MRPLVGGLAVGLAAGWNIANTGAAAGALRAAEGTSLAAVGLLTTALFATHFAVQIPGGALVDRLGARRVALVALIVIAVANGLALLTPAYWVSLVLRLVMGLGTGGAFVAGSDWVRAVGGGPAAQGVYGGVSVGGGGLAVAVVPLIEPSLGWRSPFATALAVAVAAAALALLPAAIQRPAHRRVLVSFRRAARLLWPLAVLHTASFGLSVIAGNWAVTLLRRHGFTNGLAGGIGALILLGGLVTRPLSGFVLRRLPQLAVPLVVASLVAGAAGLAVLAAATSSVPAVAVAAAVVGIASGIPFAPAFTAAQRLVADAPAASVGVVNSAATLAVLTGTPLVGLAFSLPGNGRLGFAALAACWAIALAAVPAAARALTPASTIG